MWASGRNTRKHFVLLVFLASSGYLFIEQFYKNEYTHNWDVIFYDSFDAIAEILKDTSTFREKPSVEKIFSWPALTQPYKHPDDATDPKFSYFEVLPENQLVKNQFQQGNTLQLTIVAKNARNERKRYGGDFFRVKLVTDNGATRELAQIIDNNNGTYSARLPLYFSGVAELTVTLIHPSEAIDLLRRVTSTKKSPGLIFTGVFDNGEFVEHKECNMWLESLKTDGVSLPDQRFCDFTHEKTKEPWFCKKPVNVDCNSQKDLTIQRNIDAGYYLDKSGLFTRGKNLRVLIGEPTRIVILPGTARLPSLPRCIANEVSFTPPSPSGYFLNDVWQSTHCAIRSINSNSDHIDCLKDKRVYLFGDSTIRQWYSYYVPFGHLNKLGQLRIYFESILGINTGVNLYEKDATKTVWEPRSAENKVINTSIHFAAHGPPLQNGGDMQSMPYIVDSLDNLEGGPGTVVAMTIGFHLLLYDPTVYVRRLYTIRDAVVRLLERSPGTLVVFKGLNTYEMDDVLHSQCCLSEWLALRYETIARTIFKEVKGLVYIDTWDISASTQYMVKDSLHPDNRVIENEMQVFLSFVCPS
ncbi:NXPE family member 3 [Ciona intestinalis]